MKRTIKPKKPLTPDQARLKFLRQNVEKAKQAVREEVARQGRMRKHL